MKSKPAILPKAALGVRRCAAQIGSALLLFLLLGLCFHSFSSCCNPETSSETLFYFLHLLGTVCILLPPILFLYHFCRRPCRPLRLPSPLQLSSWCGCFCFYGSLAAVCGILWQFFLKKVFSYSSQIIHSFPESGVALLCYLLSVCVLGPFLEELLFRGLIQPALQPYGEQFAIITVSLLFTLLHPHIGGCVSVFFFSCLLGWIALRTGSCTVTILFHGLHNTFAAVLLFLSQKTSPAFGGQVYRCCLFSALLFGAGVLLFQKKKGLLPDFPKKRFRHQISLSPFRSMLSAPVFVLCLLSELCYFFLFS